MGLSREQLLLEYTKCMQNTPYALRTYLQTYDNTQSRYVPLELFPDQVRLVEDYDSFNENIALKYRQAGVSTVTAAWASKKLVFVSNDKNAAKHYKLTNGCEVKAVATSKDALRGYTPTILIFDEAAFIDADSDFWAACMASLSTGGKVIVISTPNGYDPIYYEIYEQANRGMNDFKITEMYWYRDPRYTKDLYLVKTDDIVHYFLNREEYKNEKILDYSDVNPFERNFAELVDLFKQGWKPSSSWFEAMVKKLKYDKRKVAQELECNFLGSGDNVFDSNLLKNITDNLVQEPPTKMMSGGLWIWKEPEVGHKYIMGVDVSRGDSEDFSTFQIYDFDDREQVAEYIGKVPPDVLAEIAYKWGNMYKAFIVVDITGGMGVSTSRKLQELGYKDLYVDGVEFGNKWKYDPKMDLKIPGINFNSKRVQIIASFEEGLRHGLKIRSSRLLNEMNTFVYINGRPDHMKGQHDDLIMSLAMAVYVSDSSFSQLTKVSEQAKTMLESWTVQSYEKPQETYFNPSISNNNFKRNVAYQNEPSKSDYEKYLWLFGGGKR